MYVGILRTTLCAFVLVVFASTTESPTLVRGGRRRKMHHDTQRIDAHDWAMGMQLLSRLGDARGYRWRKEKLTAGFLSFLSLPNQQISDPDKSFIPAQSAEKWKLREMVDSYWQTSRDLKSGKGKFFSRSQRGGKVLI